MKLSGTRTLAASRQMVWDLFNDPERLARLLPGCEKLEPAGPGKYKVSIKFALAAFSGSYSGSVELNDRKPPQSMRMLVEGKGAPGFMKGEGQLTLEESGGTTKVTYDGEAQVGGLIAAVGQRMIEAAAKKIVQQFFDDAEKQLKL
ncbi:MAG: carbon monoxide dehydrogenase subunit G [Acidobacteria bacterium]|nr:carbon monoxide dehydrogenase subunit G [Acidobacteriota bacterium]